MLTANTHPGKMSVVQRLRNYAAEQGIRASENESSNPPSSATCDPSILKASRPARNLATAPSRSQKSLVSSTGTSSAPVADTSVRSSDTALDAVPGRPISSDICSAEPTGCPRRSSFPRRGAKSMGSLIAGTTVAGRTRPPAGHLADGMPGAMRALDRTLRPRIGRASSAPAQRPGLVATPPHPTRSRRS